MRTCVFCDTACVNDNYSKEHIVAQWLQREMDILNDTVLQINGSDENIISIKSLVLNRLVDGCVCKSCNNGWMTELENENKAHITSLIRMIDIEKELHYLSFIDHLTFSKWVFKTAILLDHVAKPVSNVPRSF